MSAEKSTRTRPARAAWGLVTALLAATLGAATPADASTFFDPEVSIQSVAVTPSTVTHGLPAVKPGYDGNTDHRLTVEVTHVAEPTFSFTGTVLAQFVRTSCPKGATEPTCPDRFIAQTSDATVVKLGSTRTRLSWNDIGGFVAGRPGTYRLSTILVYFCEGNTCGYATGIDASHAGEYTFPATIVTIRFAVYADRVNASPEPTTAGRRVRITGLVQTADLRTVGGSAVDVYFTRAGTSGRTRVATVTAAASGRFVAKAVQRWSGTWTAVPRSTSPSLNSVSGRGDFVAVRGNATRLVRLHSSAGEVRPGGTVTLSAVAQRLTSGGVWVGMRQRIVYIYFDPEGQRSAVLVGSRRTSSIGGLRFSARQHMSGRWKLVFRSTQRLAYSESKSRYVGVD